MRVPPVPHHSGWGVRCGRGCLGLGFGCAPPFLAGSLGCVCGCVGAAPVPRHFWLGCAVRVWVLGLGFRLRPATPGWGVRCGCVCLDSGFGCALPLLARVLGCVCARVRAPLVPRHSWLVFAVWMWVFRLGFRLRPATPGWGVGVCLLVCVLPLYLATPRWGVRRACVCLGSGLGCAPPLLAWGVGVCVWWCGRSPCTPPLLAGVCGAGVGVWARVSAAPRHSWPGRWGVRVGVLAPPVPRHSWLGCVAWVCVLGLGLRLRPATPGRGVWGVCALVCAFRLSPATPGWGVWCGCVCLGSGFGCAPPLLGCWGVRVGVRAPLVPRQSWLGCAVWVCMLELGLRLRPATPGWVVGVCVLVSALRLSPPLLARVCGVGVCVWAPVWAALRHSWLGCWGVRVGVRAPPVPRHSWLGCAAWACVLGLRFRLRPATRGCAVRGVCALVCAPCLSPATPCWGVRCGWVCLNSGSGCAPPLLAGVLGCACWFACCPCTPPLLAELCGVCVCVFGLRFRLRPATPGWGVGVCVCWCACSSCTLPFLVGVCVLGVCARARVLAAPCYSWLGFVVCGLAFSWHLFLCRGSVRVVRAARVCGTPWPLLLRTFPCALVVACGVPSLRASWPRLGAPRLVRSGRSWSSGRLSRRRGAFPQPGGGCAGHAEVG